MWQGFQWAMDCHRDPIYKLLAQLDVEDLCQESKMHTLPAAQKAQAAARAFTQSLPLGKQPLLDSIIDHFAYLETYGYKLAHSAGFRLANKLLPLVSQVRYILWDRDVKEFYEKILAEVGPQMPIAIGVRSIMNGSK